jgi:tetratricopeptide (TPR) repeat protein
MQYNRMNDAQKKTIGQDYLQAIEQLKQKYRAVNEEIQAMSRSLKDVKAPNISEMHGGGGALSGAFSDLTSQFTMGNLYAQAAMKGAEAVEALGQKIVDVTKEGMRLSVEAEGIEQAFNRLNRPDILDKVREATHGTVSDLELMKAAVKFDDFNLNIDEMGTLLAFAQKKAKDTGQSVDYMVDSITTGLGRQSLMILDNLGLSAAEIKEKMKETGDMTTAVGEIIREQMSQAGEYTETASDRIARANAENENALKALGDQMRETFGDKTWEELSIGLETELVKTLTDVTRGIENIMTAVGLADSAFTKWLTSTTTLMGGLKLAIESALGPLGQMLAMLETFGQKSFKEIVFDTAFEGIQKTVANTVNSIKKLTNKRTTPHIPGKGGGGGRGGGGRGGGSGKSEPVYPEGSLAKLNQELQNLKKAQDLATDPESWNNYQVKIDEVNEKVKNLKSIYTEAAEEAKKLAEYQKAQETYENALAGGNFGEILKAQEALNKLRGSVNLPDGNGVTVMGNQNTGISGAFEKSNMSLSSVNGFVSAIKSELDKADLGSQVYNKLTEKLDDATIMSNVLKELITNGVNGIDLEEVGTLLKEKMQKGDIPDEAWVELAQQINAKLAELGIDPIKINLKTGNVETAEEGGEEKDKNVLGNINKVVGGLSAVAGGLSSMGLKLPDGINKLLGGLQGVMQVIQGVQTVISVFSTSAETANTAAVVANTAAITALIPAMYAAAASGWIPFANGGIVPHAADGFIVPGNNYSGDKVHMALNSGEVVLNHAQQNNLANELEGNRQGEMQSAPYVMGEQIYLGVNTFLKRTGRGELVTTKG